MFTQGRRAHAARLGKLVVAGTALAALTAGAGPANAASPANTPVVIVQMMDGQLLSDRTTFEVGTTYGFAPVNLGEQRHELVIEPLGATSAQPLTEGSRVAQVAPLASGTAGMLVWRFDEPGSYQLACHQAAYDVRAMRLPIEVTA